MKVIFIFLTSVISVSLLFSTNQKEVTPINIEDIESDSTMAIFAGGCFWGVEAVFERLRGVEDVVSGYAGGRAETATYNQVATGITDHAESVMVTFDPEVVSYQTLLEIFFLVAHNPTQLNYQGPDYGREYRSAIFYTDEAQKTLAELYIKELDKSRYYSARVVTELNPLVAFYTAEEYHQNYMELNPNNPYIIQCDVPKIEDLERRYSHLLKEPK